MTVLLIPVLTGVGILMYWSGASGGEWGAFIAIGGFFGLCALAADGG